MKKLAVVAILAVTVVEEVAARFLDSFIVENDSMPCVTFRQIVDIIAFVAKTAIV